MRYHAPSREVVDATVFARQPLVAWRDYAAFLQGSEWPSIEALNAALSADAAIRFAAQTPALLSDGLHYEQRIAERGDIATREGNWHDLLNALIWLRYPALKQALNRRQMREVDQMGPKQRSRPQYAMTHFDEGGVIVVVRDASLMALWDAHDWYGLFWQQRQAWLDGVIQVQIFGHALLEHALSPDKLLVGKALAFQATSASDLSDVQRLCIDAIASGDCLNDPLELRPLPLSGIPGWHPDSQHEAFHRTSVCYQPRRADRQYPAARRVD